MQQARRKFPERQLLFIRSIATEQGQRLIPGRRTARDPRLQQKVEAGSSYVLVETNAPTGYAYTAEIPFSIDKDGTVKTEAPTKDDGTIEVRDKALDVKLINSMQQARKKFLEQRLLSIRRMPMGHWETLLTHGLPMPGFPMISAARLLQARLTYR